MDSLDFNPVSTCIARWIDAADQIMHLRNLAGLASSHPGDQSAIHFISSNANQIIAAATVFENGELALLAIAPSSESNETASALMRFILREMPRHGYTQLFVNPSGVDEAFYTHYGFQPDPESKQLILLLPPDRTHINSGSAVIVLESPSAFRDKALELINNTKKQLSILTPDLEPSIYDSDAISTAILEIMKRSRQTEVRILIKNTQALLEGGHALVKLYQRSTTEQILLKKLTLGASAGSQAYLLSDDCGIIYRQNDSVYRGVCYHDNRARVKTELEDFDQLWNIAVEDRNLKRLDI